MAVGSMFSYFITPTIVPGQFGKRLIPFAQSRVVRLGPHSSPAVYVQGYTDVPMPATFPGLLPNIQLRQRPLSCPLRR